jgi:tripartite-type tricarboxylate transporter receptor subunit TctC
VVSRLNKEFNQLLQTPEIRNKLQDMGAEIAGGSVSDFAKFVVTEIKRYEAIVRDSGAPME